MTMQALRPYQTKAVQQVQSAWRSGKRAPVLTMPTGSGKTTVLAHILRQQRERPALVICPGSSRQLVKQAAERFEEHDLETGVLMGRRKPNGQPIVVASLQTAVRRDLGDFKLVVVDEAHHAVGRQCLALLKRYPRAKLLGLTATPGRMDGKPLGAAFDALIEPTSITELIRGGFLVPLRVYGPAERLDLRKVRYDKKRRDFAPGSAGKAMSSTKLLGDALAHYRKHAFGLPTFIYCCNRKHAEHVCEVFNRANISTEVMDGNTPKTSRAAMFERLDSGETKCITNIGVLTEGVDYPPLRCQVILRPTLSRCLHLQYLGRGMRPAPGKRDCIVLDHADNFRRHGFPQDPQKWSLKGRAKQARPSTKKAPAPKAKRCPKCKQMVSAAVTTCPACGYVWLPEVVPGELKPLTPGSLRMKNWRWWT